MSANRIRVILLIALVVLALMSLPIKLAYGDRVAFYSGSFNHLVIAIPDELTGACNVVVSNSKIGRLTIFFSGEGCGREKVSIINSSVGLLEIYYNESMDVEEIEVINSVITAGVTRTVRNTSNLLLNDIYVYNSSLGDWIVSTYSFRLNRSSFLSLTIINNNHTIIRNSSGASLFLGQLNYGSLIIDRVSLNTSYTPPGINLRLPEQLGTSPVLIKSPEGNITFIDLNFTCSAGECNISIDGAKQGILESSLINVSKGTFSWTGALNSNLTILNTTIMGNVNITLTPSISSKEFRQDSKSTLVIANSFLGLRGANATNIASYKITLDAIILRVYSSILAAGEIKFSSIDLRINNTRLLSRTITIDTEKLVLTESSIVGDRFISESSVFYYLNLSRSRVYSTILLSIEYGIHAELNIVNSTFYRGKGLYLRIVEGEVIMNIARSIFTSRDMSVIAYGYPPKRATINAYTTESYWGSLAGPKIIINDTIVKDGGATIGLIGTSGKVSVVNWWIKPNNGVAEPSTYMPPLRITGASIISAKGFLPGIGMTTFYIVVFKNATDSLIFHTDRPIIVQVYFSESIIENITVNGEASTQLPMPMKEVIILCRVASSLQNITTNTASEDTRALSPRPAMKNNYNYVLVILLAVMASILALLLIRRRKSA